jgi:type II restriction enzyme
MQNRGRMNFLELTEFINRQSGKNLDFLEITLLLQDKIFKLHKGGLISLLKQIGTIPESIAHDSSEEKLYSKATDIVLAKSFQELGFHALVNKERANCADVVIKSVYHNYSFVADAKAFRLSRTARNQKDFKVKSMSEWRGENEYSILVCPFFKYPKNNSQIYGQALDSNVCLFSWEHLSFLLEKNIRENINLDLSFIWNASFEISKDVSVSNKNNNFYNAMNAIICNGLCFDENEYIEYFVKYKDLIIKRSEEEILYWKNEISKIKRYSKEKAVKKLLIALKVKEKIISIEKYVKELEDNI